MSSKHTAEKGPVLIRPLVLKLPIDFHCGRFWGSDLLCFLASTKAKLSHLEAGSAFRDCDSAPTPSANLFPSGVTFFFFLQELQNFSTTDVLLKTLAHNFLLPSIRLHCLGVTRLLRYSSNRDLDDLRRQQYGRVFLLPESHACIVAAICARRLQTVKHIGPLRLSRFDCLTLQTMQRAKQPSAQS